MQDRAARSLFQRIRPTSVPHVLIIESNADIAAVLQQVLVDEHLHIMIATSRQDGLQITKSLTPLLLLINSHLSDGDGITLYDQLHQRTHLSHVPAIILSTNLHLWQQQLEERGIIGLEIPLDIDDLIQVITALLPSQLL